MRALITGAGGFVGSHLAELLLKRGIETYGLLHPREWQNRLPNGADAVRGDVLDAEGISGVVRAIKPDHVYHLAAVSSVPASLKDPVKTFNVNVCGTMNLLEALRDSSSSASVLNVSTAHVYSISYDGQTLTEETPVRANTPYDASKLMSEQLSAAYWQSYGLRVITARSFNHIGPRQSPDFACSDFARQIAAIRKGIAAPVIVTGNLDAARDFTDVRDVVRAYLALLEKGRPGETYNVCSGNECSLESILDILCRIAGVDVDRQLDPTRLRRTEHLRLRGDNQKIRLETEWQPDIPMTTTLADLLEYWMLALEMRSARA